MDNDRAFGRLLSDYASEVFQESFDPELLKRKAENLRRTQADIRERKARDQRMLSKLDKLGEYAEMRGKREKDKKNKK
jgi:hypothetical protein